FLFGEDIFVQNEICFEPDEFKHDGYPFSTEIPVTQAGQSFYQRDNGFFDFFTALDLDGGRRFFMHSDARFSGRCSSIFGIVPGGDVLPR
ncbi:hypothetical protein JE599_004604, partial [Salmonella enterica]|nr:hypothetical protein [Salmonella enterica]